MANIVPYEDYVPPAPEPPNATLTVEILKHVLAQNEEFVQFVSSNSGKAVKIITTDLLLPTLDPTKANLVNQCLHISTNIYGRMDVATTRDAIETIKHLETSTITIWTTRWVVATMYALNDGLWLYQL